MLNAFHGGHYWTCCLWYLSCLHHPGQHVSFKYGSSSLCLSPQSQRSQPVSGWKIGTFTPYVANDLQINIPSLISLLSSELKQPMYILMEPQPPFSYLIDKLGRTKGNSFFFQVNVNLFFNFLLYFFHYHLYPYTPLSPVVTTLLSVSMSPFSFLLDLSTP